MAVLAVTRTPNGLNPVEGDLELSPDGKLFRRAELSEIVDQRLRVKFNFFRGEWFLNLKAGTPYFGHILEKVTVGALRPIFHSILSSTEGVTEVVSLVLNLEPRTRVLRVEFQLRLTDDEITSFAPYEVGGLG